ncbi:MAG TPA: hypothetical protein VM939_10265, partial [Gemmatimonadaceae bacterium]|nr:hypothetical protein [Gemmatimonadaceae bacterium]
MLIDDVVAVGSVVVVVVVVAVVSLFVVSVGGVCATAIAGTIKQPAVATSILSFIISSIEFSRVDVLNPFANAKGRPYIKKR